MILLISCRMDDLADIATFHTFWPPAPADESYWPRMPELMRQLQSIRKP